MAQEGLKNSLAQQDQPRTTFEQSVLVNLCAGDYGLRDRVLLEFLRTAHLLVNQVIASMRAGNASETRSLAHALKGSSRLIGALALGDLCEAIEAANGNHSNDTFAFQLQSEFESLTTVIRNQLEGQ